MYVNRIDPIFGTKVKRKKLVEVVRELGSIGFYDY